MSWGVFESRVCLPSQPHSWVSGGLLCAEFLGWTTCDIAHSISGSPGSRTEAAVASLAWLLVGSVEFPALAEGKP